MDLSFLLAGAGKTMTSFFSMTYLFLFLPFCLIVYAVTPKKAKRYVLLAESLLFFWLVSGALVAYLLISAVSILLLGLWLGKLQQKQKAAIKDLPKEEKKAVKQAFLRKQRALVFLGVFLHIGLLLVLKYTGFFLGNINSLLAAFSCPFEMYIPQFAMPIGISFFSLQALSYIIDVYHGLVKADKNYARLLLFMSFFPQIVEGPICRYGQTAEQLWNVGSIKYRNLTFGLQRILFGMMKKIVIADRLDPLVKKVFDEPNSFDGGVIILAAVCYTVQLYMDFSGSMDAVLGTAEIFGIKLPENFERPFFSKSVSEFWKRWHITLGAWFKDYIFFPVTSAKRMKNLTSSARKKLGNHFGPLVAGGIALFCVWWCNGLWHGAGWNFIFFGMYHFVLILSGNIITPASKTVLQKLHIKANSAGYKVFCMIRTTILVIIGELFFRANGIGSGMELFGRIFTDLSFRSFDQYLLPRLGVDAYDLAICAVTLMIVFAVSVVNEKGICIREVLEKSNIVVRWVVLYSLILFIVIFGAYSFGYIPVDPMYAQF